MIGLGSNRLTVCRRGGMSVTQAGKGGMEWQAGGRRPSWASPYSAQATAALKDAFTAAQWPTIRDYGFAHPEYIAAINFAAPQDQEIMYSLIPELGKSRYLVGDGTAYIILDHIGIMDDKYEMKFKYNVGGQYRAWGVFGQQSYMPINMSLTYANGIMVRWAWNGTDGIDNLAPLSSTSWHTLKIDDGYITFDGVSKGRSPGHKQGFEINYPMYLFTINPANTTPSATMNGCFEYYKHTSKATGKLLEYRIPCKHDNKNGMLDMITGTWKGNANSSGSFTISETPAS